MIQEECIQSLEAEAMFRKQLQCNCSLFIISSIEGLQFTGFDYRMSRFSARRSGELG